jgi:hypothetical protein
MARNAAKWLEVATALDSGRMSFTKGAAGQMSNLTVPPRASN